MAKSSILERDGVNMSKKLAALEKERTLLAERVAQAQILKQARES